MKKLLFTLSLVAFIGASISVDAAPRGRKANARARAEVLSRGNGYYKDVFMDGGIYLTSRRTLPAADFLGLQLDFFASAANNELTKVDTLLQHKIFTGSEEDVNGWLLYPDGAPRYRMIYVNGGKARNHLNSMEPTSRANIRNFVEAGGSYLGTCAGAFIASKGAFSVGKILGAELYFGFWPGLAYHTKTYKIYPDMRVDKGSPLLRYFDFGKDGVVAEVYHNGGCYVKEEEFDTFPKGVEVLSHYIYKKPEGAAFDGRGCVWSYKANDKVGRVVSCGSHPEGVKEGERLEYMASMMLYAMDGNPAPKVKGELKSGEVREMNKRTEDKSPAYTRIGDKQYHHFVVDVPKKCTKVVVSLEGYEGEDNFDLELYGNGGEFAFADNANYKNNSSGSKKELVIDQPKAGKMYVSVYCATTVTSTVGVYGTEYSGRTDVLNGVPYKIAVKFE